MAYFTTEQAALLAATTTRVGWRAKAVFKSSTIYRWSGDTTLDADGQEWLPTHGAVQVDGLGFSGEPVSRQINLSLPGVDATVLGLALTETDEADQQPLTLSFQLFTDDWQADTAIPIFFGLMQPPRVDRTTASEGEGAIQTIGLPVENAFHNRSRPANGRYTDADHRKRSFGDRICEFVPSLTFKPIRYPKLS